jgi:hypothetical protein
MDAGGRGQGCTVASSSSLSSSLSLGGRRWPCTAAKVPHDVSAHRVAAVGPHNHQPLAAHRRLVQERPDVPRILRHLFELGLVRKVPVQHPCTQHLARSARGASSRATQPVDGPGWACRRSRSDCHSRIWLATVAGMAGTCTTHTALVSGPVPCASAPPSLRLVRACAAADGRGRSGTQGSRSHPPRQRQDDEDED